MAGVSPSSSDFPQGYSMWMTWMEPLLDFWVCFCAAGFLSYAAIMDWRNRKRKRLVMVELDSDTNKQQNTTNDNNETLNPVTEITRKASDFATSILSKYVKGFSTSSLSTATHDPSSNSLNGGIEDNSRHGMSSQQNINNNEDDDDGNTNDSAQNINHINNNSSPRPRIPRVLFKPIAEQGAFENQDESLPPQPPALDVRSNNNDGRKSLFIPFVGKRLNREFSNTSVNSLPSILKSPLPAGGSTRSINQSSRSLSSLRLSGVDDSLSRLSPKIGDSRNSSPSTEQGDRSGLLKEERFARETWDIALERDECSICFTSLYKEEVAVCTSSHGVPVCLHLYHNRCLKVLRHRRCVLCGAKFAYRRRLPEVDVDPSGWFQTVDVDQSGGLSPKEIARVLAAQLPIDRKTLEKVLLKHWEKWDADHNGEVDKDEFFAPKRGLLAFLKKHRSNFKKIEAEMDPPDIRIDPKGWFEYFDDDKSNSLSRCEVLRALIVSFSLSNEPKICLNLRMVLDAVWPVFDSDRNDSISKSEFLEPKTGLATSLIISINLSDRGAAVL